MRTGESFGAMFRRLRMSAGLTQERLAEQSGISANGVAALEAGRRRTPRLNTVGLLCDALRLDAQQRAAMIAAATGTTAATATAPTNPLRETATRAATGEESDTTFVGRHDERQALHDAWRRKTKVVLLSGEAGVGKSTLAEQFAMDLAVEGVTVLRGRSTPEQLGVYEAFVAPVRGALGRYDGNIPTTMRDLGRLVPGLLDIGGDVLVRVDPTMSSSGACCSKP